MHILSARYLLDNNTLHLLLNVNNISLIDVTVNLNKSINKDITDINMYQQETGKYKDYDIYFLVNSNTDTNDIGIQNNGFDKYKDYTILLENEDIKEIEVEEKIIYNLKKTIDAFLDKISIQVQYTEIEDIENGYDVESKSKLFYVGAVSKDDLISYLLNEISKNNIEIEIAEKSITNQPIMK